MSRQQSPQPSQPTLQILDADMADLPNPSGEATQYGPSSQRLAIRDTGSEPAAADISYGSTDGSWSAVGSVPIRDAPYTPIPIQDFGDGDESADPSSIPIQVSFVQQNVENSSNVLNDTQMYVDVDMGIDLSQHNSFTAQFHNQINQTF